MLFIMYVPNQNKAFIIIIIIHSQTDPCDRPYYKMYVHFNVHSQNDPCDGVLCTVFRQIDLSYRHVHKLYRNCILNIEQSADICYYTCT